MNQVDDFRRSIIFSGLVKGNRMSSKETAGCKEVIDVCRRRFQISSIHWKEGYAILLKEASVAMEGLLLEGFWCWDGVVNKAINNLSVARHTVPQIT